MIMKIKRIKNRSIVFTNTVPSGWDLNIQLIMGNKYNYIVDTGLGSLSIAPIKEYIKYDNKPIIVINTHHHWDHIWGNSSFGNSMVISHKLCREMMELNWNEMIQRNKQHIFGEVEMHLPNLTFEEEIYFPEDQIRIIYTPGHTIDSISVVDEVDKVINVGDNIGDSIDEIVPSIYGEKAQYINSLLKYNEIDFDTCISGHNVILEKGIINKILAML